MAHPFLRRLAGGFLPILLLLVSLLVSLYSLSAAMETSGDLRQSFFWLLLINIAGLVLLVVLIGHHLLRLIRQYRNHVTGSRLTVRLILVFVVLVLVPVSVVYFFSLQFIQRGIDSWFDVRIEKAFENTLELSRLSIFERKREYLHKAERVRDELSRLGPEERSLSLDILRQEVDADELDLLTASGQVEAVSNVSLVEVVPRLPDLRALRRAEAQGHYVAVEEVPDLGLHVRVIMPLAAGPELTSDAVFLQALFPVSGEMSRLAEEIQSAFTHYRRLAYLREPLKFSFVLTLSLVLLLSVLSAIWMAFFFAHRLVAPIRVLAIGTRVVASGDYGKRLPRFANDELGFLVESFNEMTRKIARGQEEVRRSHRMAVQERTYLRTVLASLSSGVLTLDDEDRLTTINPAAEQILGLEPGRVVGKRLDEIAEDAPAISSLISEWLREMAGGAAHWQHEFGLSLPGGNKIVICSGDTLPGAGGRPSGHVIVIEDVTALVQAQRDAAWGEVARRLAHEIKNPLTPIQLSAERIRQRCLPRMSGEEGRLLDRATHTIVQQVEVMKELVKAFSEYARTPRLNLESRDIGAVVQEVCDLYRNDVSGIRFEIRIEDGLPEVAFDAGRFRQLLHNLIKNAREATVDGRCVVGIECRHIVDEHNDCIEVRIHDNGPGIPEEMVDRIFEPYVTGKVKGSGLGLPIVKKIVEEHGGRIWVEKCDHAGACFVIRLPLQARAETAANSHGEASS